MNHLPELHASLNARRRPEDIAQLVLEQCAGRLHVIQRKILVQAARGSLRQQWLGYTSMLQEFATPVGLQRQLATAERLFPSAPPRVVEHGGEPEAIEAFIRAVSPEIRKRFGGNDFKADRLDRPARRAAGLDISRRRYNKLFRHLTRMEDRLQQLVRELRKLRFQKVGKSSLASLLTWEVFSADVDTACFIAYYTARCNLRSEFTISGQQRPFDQIAAMLFTRCQGAPTTNWWAMAQVFPREDVLAHLSDEQKGELLAQWFAILQDIATLLQETWRRSDLKRETMIVRRGNDSSTWNNTARAWNTARDHWIALLYALGLDDLLDSLCFGKVLGLIAADVAYWHRSSGGGLHPDTFVWNELPLPWEVLAGEASCTRGLVEAVCRQHGVDPEKNGWTTPRPRTAVARFRPTPELVHGVTVGSPVLAMLLRRAGYFSGKPGAWPVVPHDG